jgi:glycosyltransferase involved in cell wall biosynthesis
VGSELPRKKVDNLLAAVASVKLQGYSIRLLKVGSAGGPRWRQYSQQVIERLKLHQEVRFLDIVPEEDLPLLYNIADCAITATALEGGFAWVAMEGMACGKPVIATKAALIPSQAEAAAIVVPDRNVELLAEAIIKLMSDSALKNQMAEAARACVLPYTWQSTAESMSAVYRLALSN